MSAMTYNKYMSEHLSWRHHNINRATEDVRYNKFILIYVQPESSWVRDTNNVKRSAHYANHHLQQIYTYMYRVREQLSVWHQ